MIPEPCKVAIPPLTVTVGPPSTVAPIFAVILTIAEIPYVNGVREGAARFFAPNGRVQAEITFQADKENGLRTIYNPELGVVVRKETLQNGVLEGQSFGFYPSGAIMAQQTFEKGLSEGRSTQFYEDGTVQQITSYEKGVIRGPILKFDQNGKAI